MSHRMGDCDEAKGVNEDRQAYDDRTDEEVESHAMKLEASSGAFLAENQTCRWPFEP
ncbi:hypothetical protein GCM10007880_60260 [Mesorhizobium amorphae]|nr:hypothetical protein GCM10007880_60260 [Mesorhizobium amorphae]